MVFRYEQLQYGDSIRLLEIQPSESTEYPIRCHIMPSHLSSNPQYEVLSCEWDSTGKTIPITINAKTHEIPYDVWRALQRVRMYETPRLIWNDALCINLEDVAERNQQAILLKDTFQSARQLLVWLGDAADSSQLVFDHLKDCVAKKKLNWNHFVGETREAFLKLCQRPWFFRTWSITELAWSTKKTTMMCGEDEHELRDLIRCTFFNSAEDTYHPLHGVDGPSRLCEMLNWRSTSSGFLYSTFCTAKDPREKPFAMAKLLGIFEFPLDYRAEITKVFRIFTQKVIETTKDINILHWLGTRSRIDGLPSWVPDFSVPISSNMLPRILGSVSYLIQYPWKFLPGLRFEANGALVIKGRFIEKIETIAEELPIETSVIPGSERFSAVLHRWELLAVQLHARKRFSQPIPDAFSDTLLAYDKNEQTNNKRPHLSIHIGEFASWYEHNGTGVLMDADQAFFSEIVIIKAWIQEIKGELSHERDWSYFARKMELACYGRRFFTTDQGSMGLAPARAGVNDELVFFPGGLYPFVVRRRDDGTYELIGDCYLYDFDIYRLFESSDAETRDFTLL